MTDDQVSQITPAMQAAESDCPYLPGRRAQFEHRWAISLQPHHYEQLLARGWRRFGRSLFRPICRACRECRSVRILLPRARLSKSQRRCRNRNTDVRVRICRPQVTDDHIELYNMYHDDMQQRRGWPEQTIDADEYRAAFVDGEYEFSWEFQYLRHDQLIGVGLVDLTDRTQSSVYFIHHPDWRDAAPGTFSVLSEIEAGRQAARDYLYLGYYIRDCVSMNYKNRFQPCEFLQAFVSDQEQPEWRLPDPPTDN